MYLNHWVVKIMNDKVKQIIGEIDPDQKLCILCKGYSNVDEFLKETNQSPLEEMLCFTCLKDYYNKEGVFKPNENNDTK